MWPNKFSVICPVFLSESKLSDVRLDEICAAVGIYVAYSDSFLTTFRDNLTVPSSRVKQSKESYSWTAWPWKIGQIRCPETSVRNYNSISKIPTETRSHSYYGGSLKSRIVRGTFFCTANWDLGCGDRRVWHSEIQVNCYSVTFCQYRSVPLEHLHRDIIFCFELVLSNFFKETRRFNKNYTMNKAQK
jgi:hypothetical protein